MKFYTEKSLRDFKFWRGGKDRAKKLTLEQLDQVEPLLEDVAPEEGWTDTAVNDMFWFGFDTIVKWLGYPSEDLFDFCRAFEKEDSTIKIGRKVYNLSLEHDEDNVTIVDDKTSFEYEVENNGVIADILVDYETKLEEYLNDDEDED